TNERSAPRMRGRTGGTGPPEPLTGRHYSPQKTGFWKRASTAGGPGPAIRVQLSTMSGATESRASTQSQAGRPGPPGTEPAAAGVQSSVLGGPVVVVPVDTAPASPGVPPSRGVPGVPSRRKVSSSSSGEGHEHAASDSQILPATASWASRMNMARA